VRPVDSLVGFFAEIENNVEWKFGFSLQNLWMLHEALDSGTDDKRDNLEANSANIRKNVLK
jgi:hypothetical protein